jgi:hypothetical protein
MKKRAIPSNPAAQRRSLLDDVTMNEQETSLLIQRFLAGKQEVAEADVLTLIKWGNLRKREAVALSLVLDGQLALKVRGTVVELTPYPLADDAA